MNRKSRERLFVIKYSLLLIILGVSEIYISAYLVDKFGVLHVITTYILTTIIGAIFLNRGYKNFKLNINAFKEFDKNYVIKPGFTSDENETKEFYAALNPILLYVFAAIFIVVPGVFTDMIGYILLMWWSMGKHSYYAQD